MSNVEEIRVTSVDDEARRRGQRAEQGALWRYQLIREAGDPALSTRARGRLVRALAGTAHPGPFGADVAVSPGTVGRWVKTWRGGGGGAVVAAPRRGSPPAAAGGVGPACARP